MRPLLVAALLVLAGCGLPRDVDGTAERVEGGVLRAGVTDNRPWTVVEGQDVSGVEARLVEDFADRVGARVEWRRGSESALIGALEERQVDLVVGGLDESAPWQERASLTRPYHDGHVWALPLGENAWQVRVERFLADLPDGEVDRLLDQAR